MNGTGRGLFQDSALVDALSLITRGPTIRPTFVCRNLQR
jgi:hypothetical protein